MSTLILGATSAVGRSLTALLSPHRPLILTSTCSDKLASLSSALPSPPESTHVVDFSDPESVAEQLSEIDPKSVKNLVYLPGNATLLPLRSLTPSTLLSDMSLNCVSVLPLLQHTLPGLKKHQGSVTLVSTVAVGQGFTRHVSVSAAKGAVEGMTRALAAELAPKVRVNCVAPSLIRGSSIASPFTSDPKMEDAVAKAHPLKRLGEAADVAEAVGFLSGEGAGWVTGQVWGVDGGRGALS